MESIEGFEGLEFSTQSIIDTLEAIRKVESLSDNEKSENIKRANELFKSIIKEKRCRKCKNQCGNLNSCEFCIRNHLESKFDKWTSNDTRIDKWIKDHQKNIRRPDNVMEWIPYSNLKDIDYTTEGGIYHKMKALWTDGRFTSWDYDNQALKRFGPHHVTIKNLSMNNRNLEQSLQEIEAHMLLTSTMSPVIRMLGLTIDGNSDLMIVMETVTYNLKNYIQENISALTWFQKYKILQEILESLGSIHDNKLIHGDLHSGIVRYSTNRNIWLIGDLRFCRPTDNPSKVSYGTMSYVAPEILKGKEEQMTIKSDIYSFAMVMWEISTGRHPFDEQPTKLSEEEIIGGKRPEIMPKTPEKYSELMEKCWDGDPSNRPNLAEIQDEIKKVTDNYYKETMSPEEKEKMGEVNFLKKSYVATSSRHDAAYTVRPNEGKSIEIIKYDQISEETSNEGVGRISFAKMSSVRVAIKTLQVNKVDKTNGNDSLGSILLELLQQKITRWNHVYNNKNIVEFLGLGIKDENKLFLVMPYANNGDLRDYLKKNSKLSFSNKVKIAKDIASGIKVLHDIKEIHGNINPNNILIFDGIAKISNLPLPFENKEFRNKDLYIGTSLYDNIGYVDPNLFLKRENYDKGPTIDIYSLGTLLWEIMSEEIPYQEDNLLLLLKKIKGGHREKEIPNIPPEYKSLYESCWDTDVSKRPTIDEAFKQLSNIN